MKRIILLTLVLCLAAGSATATDTDTAPAAATATQYGLRGGLTLDPDQFHIGGHMDLGQIVGDMRLVPNIEVGFGNDQTVVAFNGDLIYDFRESPWSLGGELGLNLVDHKDRGSDTDFGLSVLGNYRLGLSSGKTLVLEAKLGLIDSPDVKLTVGWNF